MIELLVGLTIGLMTIAVAIGTLMISRQVSGSVSEASQLQQQAAQAFRSIAQQARQAGSLRLNLAYAKSSALEVDLADPVAFEVPAGVSTVTGKDTPSATQDQLTLAYQNYTEKLMGSAAVQSQLRDCLGLGKDGSVIRSGFSLDKKAGASSGELQCKGSDGTTQPLIETSACAFSSRPAASAARPCATARPMPLPRPIGRISRPSRSAWRWKAAKPCQRAARNI